MKKVAKAINELSQEEIASFKTNGTIEVEGYTLTSDVMLTRIDYVGDNKRYEASTTDDSRMMVVVDTTVEEAQLQELKAKQFAAIVQKMRKTANLSVGDRVEIFYKCKDAKDDVTFHNALMAFKDYAVGKLKTIPLAADQYMPRYARVLLSESHKDADLSKSAFTIFLTVPTVSMSNETVQSLVGAENHTIAETLAQYMQTSDMVTLGACDTMELMVDDVKVTMQRNIHYFMSAKDRMEAGK